MPADGPMDDAQGFDRTVELCRLCGALCIAGSPADGAQRFAVGPGAGPSVQGIWFIGSPGVAVDGAVCAGN